MALLQLSIIKLRTGKTMLARLAADKLFKSFDNLEAGSLDLVMPDGRRETFGGKRPGIQAKLRLNDWKVMSNLALRGDSGFAQDYQNGSWETDNLQNLLTFGLENESATSHLISGSSTFNMLARLSYFFKRNTMNGSRRNIHAHYDLGNDFYKIWLDQTMTYSSAIFNHDQDSLMMAQNNKYDRLLHQLGSTSGHVLEIGCGWGGFAERSANIRDFSIKGVTISEAQHEYARNRLGKKAEIVLEDYRSLTGMYDHIVSIEMFEAVGEAYWQTYFSKLKSLLKANGKAMIQTITIADDKFEKYRSGGDVIRNYIFPGGMLPSPSVFKQQCEKSGFRQVDSFHFGQDYARTIEIWLENFDNRSNEIRAQGFDEKFMRMWRFYLASCIAGFRTGRISVMQAELQHA
jgi:cyclopropane-fatty-acyl-phospholipid synthase